MDNNINCNNNQKFISDILIEEITKIKVELKSCEEIYKTLKDNSKYNLCSESIKKIGNFLCKKGAYKNFTYSYPENCGEITWLAVRNFKQNNFIKLYIGQSVKNLREFAAFISFMQYNSSKFPNDMPIICVDDARNKEKEGDIKNLNFYRANIENLIKLFIKSYESRKARLNKIEIYKDLISIFLKKPTLEQYNNLMSKVSYLNGINSIDINKMKESLKIYSESEIEQRNYKFNLEVNHPSRQERKDEHEKLYTDAEPETLEGKPLEQLNEIYSFLCEILSNKEDYKIIVADLSSLFEYIDESNIDIIIANLIYMLNNNQDLDKERKTTIVKRLGQIKNRIIVI